MNTPDFIYGNIAPVFTAFNDDLTLDDNGQKNILDWILATDSVSAFFVRSGLGQMYTFSAEDIRQIAKTACAHMAGKAPVLVGCNGEWDRDRTKLPDPVVFQKQAIELSAFATDVGAAGVVHTVPDMIRPTNGESAQDVVLRYFESLASAVDAPIFIYQPPGVDVDYQMSPELLAKLADIPNIVATKVSTNDAEYLFNLIHATKDKDFSVIAGAETSYYAALYAGARAVIGQGCTINPQIIKKMQKCHEAGDRAGVLEAQHSINLLVNECRNSVDFFKRYLNEKGYSVGQAFRSAPDNLYIQYPQPLTDNEYSRFKNILESELAKF
jgi:dihydrodipicolinate synthase/N-acetylneuraminate lyase